MKKFICLLLVLFVALPAFAMGEGTRPTITITLPNAVETEPDSWIVQTINDQFDIDLKWVSLPTDADDQMTQINLMMADKSLMPDIVYFTSSSAREYEQWKAAGILVDMWPLLAKGGKNIVDYYEKVGTGDALFSTFEDGHLYRLIINVSEPGSTGTIVRKDWMDKFGIESITTLEEYVDYLSKCVNEDPDGNGEKDTAGLSGGKGDMMALYPFFAAYGTFPTEWFLQEDGTIKYGAVLPETKQALAAIADAYAKGLIDSNLISGAKKFSSELYPEGKTASFYTWCYYLTPSYSPLADFRAKNVGGDYIRIDPVAGPDGFASDRPSDPYGQNYVAITNKCTDPEAAMRLLDGIVDPEFSILIKNGVEGVDYEMNDGEYKPLLTKDELNVKGIRLFANVLERKDEYNIEIGVKGNENFAKSQEAAMPLREKIAFIREKVRPANTEYSGDLSALYQTYFWSIITGEMPVDAFDTFVEEWYAMGGAEIEAEANEYWAAQQVEFDAFRTAYEAELLPLLK